MKKLFLSSSFADVANLFIDFVNEECKGKSVTFIPTASIVEEIAFYVENDRKALESIGLIIDILEISTATDEEIQNKLRNNDYIYVSGGNTFFLLQELKKTGADKIIIEQINFGKTYIGASAGSIILSPNIEYVKGIDDFNKAETLINYSGLNIVDFYPVPHYTNVPFKDAVEEIISKYESELNLLPISNTQVIVVNNDKFKVLN